MTRKKSSEERIGNRIKDTVENLDKIAIEFILFAHAFAGCDTTSAIHMLGKKSIFLKMESSETLRNIAKQFYIVGNASSHFFEELCSPGSSLQQIRKQKYNNGCIKSPQY